MQPLTAVALDNAHPMTVVAELLLSRDAWRLHLLTNYCPVPVSVTTCGLLAALWLTVAAPLIVPTALGVKVTVKVHLFFAATVMPQGVVPPGTAVKSPLPPMELMLRGIV